MGQPAPGAPGFDDPRGSGHGDSGARHATGTEPPDPTFGGSSGAQQTGLLTNVGSLREEWQRVQSTFVDDPQRAVQEATALLDRTLDEIKSNVASGHSGAQSTEDLRVSFQRHRDFFQRLLSA